MNRKKTRKERKKENLCLRNQHLHRIQRNRPHRGRIRRMFKNIKIWRLKNRPHIFISFFHFEPPLRREMDEFFGGGEGGGEEGEGGG